MLTTLLHRTSFMLVNTLDTTGYSPSEWIYFPNMDRVAGVPSYYWKIDDNNVLPMTEEEKAAHEAVHLQARKDAKLKRLKTEVRDAIYVRYPADNQQTLNILATYAFDARAPNYARADYIKLAVDWIETALTYYYMKEAEIMAATTTPQLDNITWDTVTLWQGDPMVTIRSAMAIVPAAPETVTPPPEEPVP